MEQIHVGFRAALAAEPHGAARGKIADDDAIGMSFFDRDFVNADDARLLIAGHAQLLAHMDFVEIPDDRPTQMHQPRNIMDRHHAAQAADLHGEAQGVFCVARASDASQFVAVTSAFWSSGGPIDAPRRWSSGRTPRQLHRSDPLIRPAGPAVATTPIATFLISVKPSSACGAPLPPEDVTPLANPDFAREAFGVWNGIAGATFVKCAAQAQFVGSAKRSRF